MTGRSWWEPSARGIYGQQLVGGSELNSPALPCYRWAPEARGQRSEGCSQLPAQAGLGALPTRSPHLPIVDGCSPAVGSSCQHKDQTAGLHGRLLRVLGVIMGQDSAVA